MLPTKIWYPAISTSGGLIPDLASAPYPLLVFSQGYDLSVSAYGALLVDWASAGFVVAAPTYPHTDPSDPAALDESDILNHPADLRFVISNLIETARRPGNVLSGLIKSNEIGLIGHSDGGDVSLAVAESSCCKEASVKAAAILSGAELATLGGAYLGNGSMPLIVVLGSSDTINVPACSAQIYDNASAPKYYLDLLGAGHEQPYIAPGSYRGVVARVTTDFFDAELAGRRSATATMMKEGNVAGATQITDGRSAPTAPGSCTGAPG
jgi:dienelactone hydrolase